jgi:hypothetical protein
MSTELITQLIILATAIVGLYKAATYKPAGNTEAASNNHEPGPVAKVFAGLLSFVGIFAFMLAMPAFIWAFTWITGNINKSSESDSVIQYSIPYEISSNPSKQELMLAAASNIPNSYSRGEALTKVVDNALQNKEYRIAIIAASAIPNSYTKGTQLEKVLNEINKQQIAENKQMPNKALNSQPSAAGTPKSGAH